MSNKKWFWVTFFTLSCCEFGQFVYSQNSSVNVQAVNSHINDVYCHTSQVIDNTLSFNVKSARHFLPR